MPSSTAKGQRTKQRIIEKAVLTIAKRGFEGVVLSEIAKSAGVTRASIIQYFGSRENLIESTIEYLGQVGRNYMLEFMSSRLEIADLAERYVRAHFAWAAEHHAEAVLLTYLIARAGYDKETKAKIELIFCRGRKSLAEWIEHGKKTKQYKVSSPAKAAICVHSTLLGFFVQYPFSSPEEVANYEALCVDCVRKFLK